MTTKTVLTFVFFCITCGFSIGQQNDKFPGPDVKVERVLNVPTFTVNGEPFTIPCFETYAPQFKFFDEFAKTGTKLYSFNINAGAHMYNEAENCWLEPDKWDFSLIDQRVAAVLKADPDALIIPRIYLGLPKWWDDANPDQLQVLDNGKKIYKEPNRNGSVPKNRTLPSIVSEKWRNDLAISLKKVLNHIHTADYADHIFGYLIAGLDTEEWYHWSSGSDELSGYEKPMQIAFQKWLKDKYKDTAALRSSWNRADIDFNNVIVPAKDERFDLGQGTFRDPTKKMNVIDFYTFYNDIVPQTIDYFAKIIKDKTKGTKVTGAFYGFMYEFAGDPEYGHNALETYIKSKNLDFIFVTASYGNRNFGSGSVYERSPAMSVMINGKLWYYDNDSMSFVSKLLLKDKMSKADYDECFMYHCEATDTPQQSRWLYQREAGYSICKGFYMSFFDLHGGHYSHPELLDEIKKLNSGFDDSKNYDRSSNSQILIVVDELSCAYATFRSDLLRTTLRHSQYTFQKIGAPVDHVLLNDLDKLDTDRYKMVIFLNTYNMTDKQRQLARQKLLNNERYVVWCYAPGYCNGNKKNSAESIRDITGIGMEFSPDENFITPQISLVESENPLSQALLGTGQKQFGADMKCCRLAYVTDKDAVKLGVFPDSNNAAMAVKNMGGYTSIYTITSQLPASIWREFAKAAGVHIYNDRDDTFFANKSYAALHPDGPGKRTIKFPVECDLFDVIENKVAAQKTSTFTRDYQNGQTAIFRYIPVK